MATRIRLQRHGRKGYAFYQVIVADSRAPRDGKFIERIGSYNPNTNPATIDLNFERALYWLQVGAQPTDTARMVLSREGVCMKKHLLDGVKKGAFDEAAAETKFQEWLTTKKTVLQADKDKDQDVAKATAKALLDAEKETNKARAAELLKKKAALAAETAAAAAETMPAVEVAPEPSATEAVAAEPTPVAEAMPAVEVTPEPSATEVVVAEAMPAAEVTPEPSATEAVVAEATPVAEESKTEVAE